MGKTWKLPPLPPKLAVKPPQVDFVSGSEGAEVYFKVVGSKALQENLMMLPQIAIDAAGYEMAVIGHEVIEDAKENYVPYLTGALHDSGQSDEYEPNKVGNTQIAMWFGGEVGPEALEHGIRDVRGYALEQHENLEFKHAIGQAKYLERPFMKVQSTVLPRIAKRVAEALGEQGSSIQNPAFIELALSDK